MAHAARERSLGLDELRDKRSVEALYRAVHKLHPYLSHDGAHALAVKAIIGLGKLADPAADAKLKILAESDEPILRTNALRQLRRREEKNSHG
jgi:HEAT repeat protein